MLLAVNNLHVTYRVPGHKPVEAVKGVSFQLDAGQALGIVGESGCGKSSLAKAVIGLLAPAAGEILVDGKPQTGRHPRDIQMVFQDAAGSLNPRMTIRQALEEVLRVHRMVNPGEREARIGELLDLVGLPGKVLGAYPREISGGQCQRVSFARCLALKPRILLADEPVSALDVSVQARILNLMRTLQRELNLGVLLISHDLAVVRTICDRVCVMHGGEFVETGNTDNVLETPEHPYTRTLLAAVPDVGRSLAGSTVDNAVGGTGVGRDDK